MASNDVARFAAAEATATLQQHITGKMATLQAA
jgi:CHASE1-domain containing sensor protein